MRNTILADPTLLAVLNNPMMPKFLATRQADGVPNVVPVTSLSPAPDAPDTLIFGNFLLWKSIRNLEQDQRVGVCVMSTSLEGWVFKGDFLEFQRAGAYVDRLNSSDLLRYNAYTGIRNAGVVRVRQAVCHFALSKLRVASDFLLAKWASRRLQPIQPTATTVPAPTRHLFAQMQAVKVLAYLDSDGYPVILPVLSLQPADAHTLVCAPGLVAAALAGLPSGARVAANVLSLDAISYQVKGTWLGMARSLGAPLGLLSVEEVYAGGPPIPGKRVA